MSMIRADHLTFSYAGAQPVFEDVGFVIDTEWKLALVGRNGRGKTTLLQLLAGRYAYSGNIHASVRFSYFPCEIQDGSCPTREVLQTIAPFAQEWEMLRELSWLALDEEVLDRPFDTLSQGEQTKVQLAALFLDEDSFQLIDEPTNHLDARSRSLVAAYLKRKRGFILVCHDRLVLDACTDHIMALGRDGIEICRGSYSAWLENVQRRQNDEEVQNEQLKKDIRRLREAVRRTSGWSDQVEASKHGAADKGYVGHKAAKMMKRSKAIEARCEEAIAEKRSLLRHVERMDELKISPLSHHSDVLVRLNDVAPCYEGRMVCAPLSAKIRQGERVCLSGRNGCGKSSLLKVIMGEQIAHTGTVELASGLVISCVPQDASFLCGLPGAYAKQLGIDESLFKALLRKMGFARADFEQEMSGYSDGQKKKVLIAGSLCQQAHLYIWDEPLNFIDIESRMQIESLLRRYAPTMLIVEHDQAFQEQIDGRILQMHAGKEEQE